MFVHFSCLGAVLKFPRALLFSHFSRDIFVFFAQVFWLGVLFSGLLPHGMRLDENVHLR
jgi:hypothetical protein